MEDMEYLEKKIFITYKSECVGIAGGSLFNELINLNGTV